MRRAANSRGVDPTVPPESEIRALLDERRNWGRWGENDQRGTLNLITDETRRRAVATVELGQTISLAHLIEPNLQSERSVSTCQVRKLDRGGGSGACMDHFGIDYHGFATTHIDALCHVWQDGVMWNGRMADNEVAESGVAWGDIDAWSDGIVTRGVLADIPTHRGVPYVTPDAPVHGAEIEAALNAAGVAVRPGDALLVHSGRTSWNEEQEPWEQTGPRWNEPTAEGIRPGLHATCMEFIRDNDVAVLMWDMLDLSPSGYSLPWSVHNAISAFGLAVVDNVCFDRLLPVVRPIERHELMIVVAPLRIAGGTGSPVNPLAIL